MKTEAMKTEAIIKNLEELPIGLSPEDIGKILGISRASAYNLVNSEGFPVLRIGKRLVILKESFLRWVEENNGSQLRK